MIIVFYISGHGFGHATRDIEVIDALSRQAPGVEVVVRTAVRPTLFELATPVRVHVQALEADTGAVQIDSLRLDEPATVAAAARFYAEFERRVADEAQALERLNASVVVGDIPPLAFAAAHRTGVPGVALGNFTWDWIYEGFPRFEAEAPGVLDTIRAAYRTPTRALRLPFHGGFAPMRDVVRDIPLVARRSTLSRAEARRAFGFGSLPVVLASFGAYGAAVPYQEIAARGQFAVVVTDHEVPDETTALRGGGPTVATGGYVRFVMRELATRGLLYKDLVAAADVVVSKPGYGVVSECIANNTALLYTSRGRFVEHDLFVAEMPRVLRCRYISQDDLLAGRWSEPVEALLQQPSAPSTMALDGADVAAREIVNCVDRR